MRGAVVALLATGCFSKPGPPATSSDAKANVDASVNQDAYAPACTKWGEFQPASQYMAVLTSNGITAPAMSADELDLFYRDDNNVIVEVVREHTSEAFGPEYEHQLLGQGTPAWLSNDRLRIYYLDANNRLLVSSRLDPSSQFQASVSPALEIDTASAAFAEGEASFVFVPTTGIGLEFKLENSGQSSSLHTAEGGMTVASPSIGELGRSLVFSSVDSQGKGSLQIGAYQLTQGGATLTNVVPVQFAVSLPPTTDQRDPILSHDGSTLYFMQTDTTGSKLYYSTRTCLSN